MPSKWNPNAPDVLGLEWAPDIPADAVIASLASAPVQRFTATTTETVDSLWVYLDPVSGIGPLIAEIYVAGNEVSTAVPSPAVYTPSALVQNNGWVRHNPFGGAPPIPGDVANAGDTLGIDSVYYGQNIQCVFPVSGVLAGQRLLNLAVQANIIGSAAVYSVPDFPAGAYSQLVGTYIGPTPGVYSPILFSAGELLPTGSGGWVALTAAELAKFAVGSGSPAGRVMYLTNMTTAGTSIDLIAMGVAYVAENRECLGVVTSAVIGWTQIPLLTPSGGAWSKVAGATYSVVLRRPFNPNQPAATVSWRGLGGSNVPFAAPTAVAAIDSYGRISAMSVPSLGSVQAFRLAGGGADRAESQPYDAIGAAEVYAGQPNAQTVTATATGAYGAVACWVQTSAAGTDVAPTAALNVTLTDMLGAVLAGPATIQPSEVPPSSAITPAAFRRFQLQFPAAATLTAGTDYQVVFSSLTPAVKPGWLILMEAGVDLAVSGPNAYKPGPHSGVVYESNYGPTPHYTTIAALVISAPPTPGSFAVTAASQILPPTFGWVPLPAVASIPYAVLTWAQTALAAKFAYYQIQRTDRGGPWADIALISAEVVGVFADFEGRIGEPSSYRMRSVRYDGAGSAWTAVLSLTPIPPARGMMFFTSNENPALSVAFPDAYQAMGGSGLLAGSDRSLQFKDAADVVLQRVYGRDNEVAFRPIERRGITLQRTILLNSSRVHCDVPGAPGGPDWFKPLRDLASSALSYVCVRDDSGLRLLSSLTVPSGDTAQPGHRTFASIMATQITDVFSTPDAGP